MIRSLIPVMLLSLASLVGGKARGVQFYSVDVVADRLVQVDVETGVGTPLLDLGTDVISADLACFNGYLYALLNDFYGGAVVRLAKIDLEVPQVLFMVDVSADGRPIRNAEGLAAGGGRLLISYCGDCILEGPWSNAIGELEESGEVHLLYDYLLLDSRADSDGLADLPNGHLLSMDLYYLPDTDRFAELVLPPNPAFITRGTHSPPSGMNDLTALENGDVWAVDQTNRCINRLGSDGGILESRPYDPGMELTGLAPEGCAGLPTPVKIASWGRIKALYK